MSIPALATWVVLTVPFLLITAIICLSTTLSSQTAGAIHGCMAITQVTIIILISLIRVLMALVMATVIIMVTSTLITITTITTINLTEIIRQHTPTATEEQGPLTIFLLLILLCLNLKTIPVTTTVRLAMTNGMAMVAATVVRVLVAAVLATQVAIQEVVAIAAQEVQGVALEEDNNEI